MIDYAKGILTKVEEFINIQLHGIQIGTPYKNLFISSAIKTRKDVLKLKSLGVAHVIDLSGHIDIYADDWISYLYFPFEDIESLPDVDLLRCVVLYGFDIVRLKDEILLVHCTMGLNRSALVTGYIMGFLGIPPKTAIEKIREVRGNSALSNKSFEKFLLEL